MRISLIYNEHAGSGLSVPDLRRDIERHGHQVVAMVKSGPETLRQVHAGTELIAVAGGDGTVKRVATGLAGCGIPVAILPFGIANNIASSLGLADTTQEVIAGWGTARRVPFDLGIADGLWDGERHFVESVGGGLVADGIIVMDSEAPHDEPTPDQMIEKALWRFRDVLGALRPHPCRLTLDGVTQELELLLVEVLNIVSVGPGLRLIDRAEPDDGQFDVVTAGDEHRLELERYLRDRIEGRPARLTLPSRRSRQVEMSGWKRIHLDDSVHTEVVERPLHLRVDRAALEILVPYPT